MAVIELKSKHFAHRNYDDWVENDDNDRLLSRKSYEFLLSSKCFASFLRSAFNGFSLLNQKRFKMRNVLRIIAEFQSLKVFLKSLVQMRWISGWMIMMMLNTKHESF